MGLLNCLVLILCVYIYFLFPKSYFSSTYTFSPLYLMMSYITGGGGGGGMENKNVPLQGAKMPVWKIRTMCPGRGGAQILHTFHVLIFSDLTVFPHAVGSDIFDAIFLFFFVLWFSESGQTHTYKVVFIDKPFIQKHMTVRDRNQTFHKVSLKYAYTHATHAGSFMKVPDANGNDIGNLYRYIGMLHSVCEITPRLCHKMDRSVAHFMIKTM